MTRAPKTDAPALNDRTVSGLFAVCLAPDPAVAAERETDVVPVEGVVHAVYLDRDELEKRKADIVALLAELPDGFHEGLGGGHSFLAACEDRHGRLWTGLHIVMEQLFLLGLGLELVREPFPLNEMRKELPGGMPYYTISREVRG